MDQNKHLSTLIRKKWRRRRNYICCITPISENVTKLMRGRNYCTTVKYFRSRERMIHAKKEISELIY